MVLFSFIFLDGFGFAVLGQRRQKKTQKKTEVQLFTCPPVFKKCILSGKFATQSCETYFEKAQPVNEGVGLQEAADSAS